MGAAVERVVRHALFEYTVPDSGVRRLAYRGERIRVAGDDLERGERFDAFAVDESELEPVAAVVVPTPVEELGSPAGAEAPTGPVVEVLDGQEVADDAAVSAAGGNSPENPARPPRAAAKEAWVDFAVTLRAEGVEEGAAREEANSLTKAELIALFGA